MTLLISKKDRTFDFIHPDEESPQHITHLSREKLSEGYLLSNTKKQLWKSYQINKKCEELAQKLSCLKDDHQLKPELWTELMQKIPIEEVGHIPYSLTDSEMRQTYRNKMYEKKMLIPVKPVWSSSHCYTMNNWLHKYGPFIEDIYMYISSYIDYLNNKGYEIKVNERDLQYRVLDHIYKTSLNVLQNYVFLK